MYMTLLGSAVTVAGAYLFGAELYKTRKEEVELLSQLCALVSHTEEQISTFKAPLDRIYESFSSEALERCGFLSDLRRGEGEKSIACLEKRIPNEAVEELRSFLSNLGKGYEKGQIALCVGTLKRLERVYSRRKEELSQKRELYRALPLLLALLVIIILI